MCDIFCSYAKIHIPIIASVSEHQPTTWVSFFFDLHILVCTFPAGLWFCIRNISTERVFGMCPATSAFLQVQCCVSQVCVSLQWFCTASARCISPVWWCGSCWLWRRWCAFCRPCVSPACLSAIWATSSSRTILRLKTPLTTTTGGTLGVSMIRCAQNLWESAEDHWFTTEQTFMQILQVFRFLLKFTMLIDRKFWYESDFLGFHECGRHSFHNSKLSSRSKQTII